MTKFTRFSALAAIAALALPAFAVAAQPGAVPPPTGPVPPPPNGPSQPTGPVQPLEYAVKFVCGRAVPGHVPPPVAQGSYFTLINVHNPNRRQEFTHKIALARLGGAGPMTGFQPYTFLPYDAAADFDCNWIQTRLVQAGSAVPPLFTGFFVIQSPYELDVVAVYTAAPNTTQQVATMHTERVPVRRVQ